MAKKSPVRKMKSVSAQKAQAKPKSKSKAKITPEELLVQHIVDHEIRRNVIPEGMGRTSWDGASKQSHPKETLPRKVSGKKPIFPLADSK